MQEGMRIIVGTACASDIDKLETDLQDQGVNAACDKAVYRIDVGLSKGCGDGHPEVCFPVRSLAAWRPFLLNKPWQHGAAAYNCVMRIMNIIS